MYRKWSFTPATARERERERERESGSMLCCTAQEVSLSELLWVERLRAKRSAHCESMLGAGEGTSNR